MMHVLVEGVTLASGLFETLLQGSDCGPPTRLPNLSVDVFIVLFYAVIVGMINWGMRLWIVLPLARRVLIVNPLYPGAQRRSSDSKAIKMSLCFMEMLFYATFSCMNYLILSRETWAWPSRLWWLEFEKKDPVTGSSVHEFMTEPLAAYFLLYAGRYLQGIVSVYFEPRRKDFFQMEVHHILTFALVGLSYFWGWSRVGFAIMLLLDPADVPLHAAKICKVFFSQSQMPFYSEFLLTPFVPVPAIHAAVHWRSEMPEKQEQHVPGLYD